MSKALALTTRAYSEARQLQFDLVGSVIVISCGLALMLAGPVLPL